jgi:polygalacturonase
MNSRISLSFAILLAAAALPASAKVCDAKTYGAKADGVTKNTKAIQAAIDACSAAGGGTVKLSGGTLVSGPIVIRSQVTLDIDKGTTLLGSPDHADYPAITEFRAPGW